MGAHAPQVTQAELDAATAATQAELDAEAVIRAAADVVLDGRLDSVEGGDLASAVLTVAASDSRAAPLADYQCDGSADQVQVIAALDALVAAGKKGTVLLLDGTFSFSGEVPVLATYDGLAVIGAGMDRTIINGDPGAGVSFFELSQASGSTLSGFRLADFYIDGSGWTQGAADAYGNATITDTGLGVCERITVERVKIRTANRSCSGIVAHNDSVTGFAPVVNNHWRVVDCDVKCDGDFVYGIKVQKRTEHVWVEDNYVELPKANVANETIGAFNCIAIYGGSRYFHVGDNTCKVVAAHSPIAVSPARDGEVGGNLVVVTAAVAGTIEAGIEVEFKAGHSDDTTPTANVAVVGNTVIGAYNGILVTNREGATNVATQGPHGVTVAANQFVSCVSRDVNVEHGLEIALGVNGHRSSNSVTNRYQVGSAVTLTGDCRVGKMVAQGSGAVIESRSAAGTVGFSVDANGRVTITAERIDFNATNAQGLRNSSTGGVYMDTANAGASNEMRVGGTAVLLAVSNEIRINQQLKFNAAALEQTTVGAAGGASAPPASPTKWLKVKDSAGTTLCIPAYAAS